VLRIGTLPLAVLPLGGLPLEVTLHAPNLTIGAQVHTFHAEAQVRLTPPPRRTPPGQHTGCSQTSPEPPALLGFDVILGLSTRHQWFTCIRLPDSHLTGSRLAFSATLTTPALYRRSLRWFEASPCRAAPEDLPPSPAHHRFQIRHLLHDSSFNVRVRTAGPPLQYLRVFTFLTFRGASRVTSLFEDAIVWDQHACLPLKPDADFEMVRRHAEAGVTFVSINVGYAPHGLADSIGVLSCFRNRILAEPERYVLPRSAADVVEAKASGRLAIAFDLEDANPLEGHVELVRTYYDLGVRTMLLTYNRRNLAGCGCLDEEDDGLIEFGRAVVAEMNRVGMVVDASHCSYRASMELFEVSQAPVIFSHSGVCAVYDHPRNLRDDQMRACAAMGGVIGICGVGHFLGSEGASLEAFMRHLEYALHLVGPKHVGIGTDFVFDLQDLEAEMSRSPGLFVGVVRDGPQEFLPPERLLEVAEALVKRGHSSDAVLDVLGRNFLRVASEVWR
jgi:membrane dipeptidase